MTAKKSGSLLSQAPLFLSPKVELISGDGPTGISATGITGNSIFGNDGAGVVVAGSQPSILTLSGNDIFDNTTYEIQNQSGIAIIATDNMAVEDSSGTGGTRGGQSRLPLHRHCLFRLGIHLGEMWYLSELSAEMRRQRRFRCLLTAPPLSPFAAR